MKAIAYKKREEEILKKIVSLLMEDIKPNRILLFGSRADDSNLFFKPKVKAKEISQDIEISVRQVYRDINCLKLAGIPIYSDRNGFTLMPDFFMPKISLEFLSTLKHNYDDVF